MANKKSITREKLFEEMFTSNYSTLFSLGYRISRDRDFTKDMIQAFFLEWWEKNPDQDKIENLRAYLHKSFYRKMVHEVKKQKKITFDYLDESKEIAIPSFEDLWIEHESEQIFQNNLHQAMEKLPDQQKQMLKLRFQQGLNYDQIAKNTGKSRQTIYNQIHTALKKLRHLLTVLLLFYIDVLG